MVIRPQSGANVNAEDEHGRTPIHGSAELGDEVFVHTLLEAGADIHISFLDRTSLDAAIHGKHTAVVDILLHHMASDDLDRWSVQSIVKHLFTKDSAPADNKHVVLLQPYRFPQLCARLMKEIHMCVCVEDERSPSKRNSSCGEGDHDFLNSISAYRVFRDPTFLHIFLCHLQNKALFHLLLTSSSTGSPHHTFLFLATVSGQDALIQEVLSSYLIEVQQLPGFSDHLERVLYAACNNGSLTTVRALLAAGIKVDFRMAYTPMQVILGCWCGKQEGTATHP